MFENVESVQCFRSEVAHVYICLMLVSAKTDDTFIGTFTGEFRGSGPPQFLDRRGPGGLRFATHLLQTQCVRKLKRHIYTFCLGKQNLTVFFHCKLTLVYSLTKIDKSGTVIFAVHGLIVMYRASI